jgi:hypothetical protein
MRFNILHLSALRGDLKWIKVDTIVLTEPQPVSLLVGLSFSGVRT